LLEAMQEKQVTIGDETFKLPNPFLVLATQNPVEQEGTYPLPEAQMDRFMLKVVITYPTKEDERKVIAANISKQGMPKANIVLKPEDILAARNVVKDVYMDEKIERYIVDIVFATRFPKEYKLEKFAPLISYGGYVIPEDVRAVCLDVMRHRIGLTYEAEAENITTEHIINELLNAVEVP
jgi:MoxR-like ATPase